MEIEKNIKKNSLILMIITLIILVILLKDHFLEIINSLKDMNFLFLLLAILFYFLYVTLKAYVVYKTVNDKSKLSLKEAIKHNIIAQFFNGITPFSTGGQPMEIYMLTKHNISAPIATGITIQNFIFYQTALVLSGVLAILSNCIFKIFPDIKFLKYFVLLGFLSNTVVAVALYIIMLSEKMTKTISNFIIKLLHKIRIIKDLDKATNYWEHKLKEFHSNSKVLLKRKKLFFLGILINLISITCLYIVPLFIIKGLTPTNIGIITTLTASAYIAILSAFVPAPGATGGIEYGFYKFFGKYINTVTLNTTLIVWRFITYYLGVILGGLIFSFEKKGEQKCE